MPTGFSLAPSGRVGVSVTTAATINMHMDIPAAPMRSSALRPNRSAIQVALRVKMMLKVPLSAFMSWICLLLVKTCWYIIVEYIESEPWPVNCCPTLIPTAKTDTVSYYGICIARGMMRLTESVTDCLVFPQRSICTTHMSLFVGNCLVHFLDFCLNLVGIFAKAGQ